MNRKTEIPTLGIDAFESHVQSDYRLLFHEADGKNYIDKPHKHDFFMMFLIRKGSGFHSIDFKDYLVADRQVHLLFPGQVHRWELGETTSGFQLMVSRRAFETSSSFLHLAFILNQNHQTIDLSPELFNALWYELESVQRELSMTSIDWDLIQLRSKVALQIVGREAERAFDNLGTYRSNPLLIEYQALIERHFETQKNVAFYAGNLHISANYLNILCKRHLHVPATYLIYNRVILEAKRLLLVSGKSAKEIAFELGFSDLPHFSNFFKARTGHSPRAFRHEL